LSAVVEPQAVHDAPPVPQVLVEAASQWTPEQQPFGHDVASHTHAPFEQCCPVPHAAPPPHAHVPPLPQPSPLEPQLVHAPPSVPHAPAPGVTHVVPEQHPVGHELALHTQAPPTQACPVPQAALPPQVHVPLDEQPSALAPHAMQAPPLAPQAVAEGVTHVVPEQHPFGQLVALHPAQAPALHTSVDGQP
jgi:hypothetical protein